MDIYAANTRAYMERTGATPEDFARVAVKSHRHASLNPNAQYRTEVTLEEVLSSRMISDPLTLLMCSPIGDGAAAIVFCSEDRVRSLSATPVRVRSCALVSGTDRRDDEPGAAERAASKAYEAAGLGPEDLDVLELHDATASAEVMMYEELGICGPGEGPELLRSGATSLGGRRPAGRGSQDRPGGERRRVPSHRRRRDSGHDPVDVAGRGRTAIATSTTAQARPSPSVKSIVQTQRSSSRSRLRQTPWMTPAVTGRRNVAELLIPMAMKPSFHTPTSVATDATVSATDE
jgi:acetyl-CoA acetyltransferase